MLHNAILMTGNIIGWALLYAAWRIGR